VLTGQKLKTLRNNRNITVRQVEQASRRIAEDKQDKEYFISNGWLAQLENGLSKPNICKLFSLSVIYHVGIPDLLSLYGINIDDIEKYRRIAEPHLTQLISDNSNENGGAPSPISAICAEQSTRLISKADTLKVSGFPDGDDHMSSIIYGHLGLADYTLYPMIRPGALLKIDTSQDKLTSILWSNEYDRPIFFIELREAYACGWCELKGNQLRIIPYHSPLASMRQFTYPREAEIVGRVIGYSTHCVDLESLANAKVRIRR